MSMSEGSTGTMMASALLRHFRHVLRRHRRRACPPPRARVGRNAHLPGAGHAAVALEGGDAVDERLLGLALLAANGCSSPGGRCPTAADGRPGSRNNSRDWSLPSFFPNRPLGSGREYAACGAERTQPLRTMASVRPHSRLEVCAAHGSPRRRTRLPPMEWMLQVADEFDDAVWAHAPRLRGSHRGFDVPLGAMLVAAARRRAKRALIGGPGAVDDPWSD